MRQRQTLIKKIRVLPSGTPSAVRAMVAGLAGVVRLACLSLWMSVARLSYRTRPFRELVLLLAPRKSFVALPFRSPPSGSPSPLVAMSSFPFAPRSSVGSPRLSVSLALALVLLRSGRFLPLRRSFLSLLLARLVARSGSLSFACASRSPLSRLFLVSLRGALWMAGAGLRSAR